jgi:hypothetical protein
VDEILILSIKGKLNPEYVENMPRLDRQYALKEVLQLIEAEKNAVENARSGGRDTIKF